MVGNNVKSIINKYELFYVFKQCEKIMPDYCKY